MNQLASDDSSRVNSRYARWLPALAAGILALVVYWPALFNDFVYDDVAIVKYDQRLDDPGHIIELWYSSWWPKGSADGISRPLTSATFWAQVQLSPESKEAISTSGDDLAEKPVPRERNPFWFHLVNLLIFAACSSMVALLAIRWLGVLWAGWAAGLLFAAHPLHVEVAANVVGRAEMLSAFFVTLGLYLYLGWREQLTVTRSLGIAACVLLGGLSKEHGYLLAPMLGIVELVERRRAFQPILARPWHLPLVAMILVVAGLAFTQRQIASSQLENEMRVVSELDNPMHYASSVERVVTPFKLLGRVTELFLFPVDQSPDYSPSMLMPTSRVLDGWVLLGFLTFLAWLVATIYAWRRRNVVLAPLLILPITWVIPSNTLILIGTIFGERLLTLMSVFVPIVLIGLLPRRPIPKRLIASLIIAMATASAVYFWLVYASWSDLINQIVEMNLITHHWPWLALGGLCVAVAVICFAWYRSGGPRPIIIATACLVLGYGWAAQSYIPAWQNQEAFILSTTIRHEKSGRFQGFYASLLMEKALYHRKTAELMDSGTINQEQTPFSHEQHAQLGDLLLDQSRHHAHLALQYWPRQARPYSTLAVVEYERGNIELARQYAEFARRSGVSDLVADYVMGELGEGIDRKAMQARAEELEKEIETNPDDQSRWRELGRIYYELFEWTDAREAMDQAVDVDTEEDPEILTMYLDILDRSDGDEIAHQIYLKWLAREPDNLAILLDASIWHTTRERNLSEVNLWLNRLESQVGGDPKVIFARGLWHQARNNREAALSAYDKAIKLSPQDDPRRAHYIMVRDRLAERR